LLWSAVSDPERLFGAVPNLVVEASNERGVAARLRLRIGDRSITFRGIARLVDLVPEQLCAELEIEAVHGRSDGALDGRIRLRLLAEGGGTRIVLEPDLVLSGRAPTVAPERLAEAGGRLIPRWFGQLASTSAEPRPTSAVTLTVVPDAEAGSGSGSGSDEVPAPAAEPTPPVVPTPLPTPAPEPAPPLPPVPPAAEPHGPTLTLITGEAQDAGPAQKAPLRLVSDAEQDGEVDAQDEPDLWSRGPGRLPGPLWILAAAALGLFGLAAVLLRRLLRRR
jgi:carbon monoxide dehydrogenase subunit G